ncbi:MAG: hypothetical protein D6824_03240 [Planctomycetota bacterium]|nr:MAG: hypothetical protein D6824_03240 [Planctomycetota bacterium]
MAGHSFCKPLPAATQPQGERANGASYRTRSQGVGSSVQSAASPRRAQRRPAVTLGVLDLQRHRPA